MAPTNMFLGNCEIVELEEDLNPGEIGKGKGYMLSESKREDKERRSPAGNISSIEDDLNQLFEIYTRRHSSHELSRRSQASASKRNSSKRPIKAGGSYSPGYGTSERVNLKQALRGLCLSQASEMAAMKRSSKSPGSSQAGRIVTMYRNVVVEDCVSDHSQDDRRSMVEISLVPEESCSNVFGNISAKSEASGSWPSKQSSFADRGASLSPMSSERGFESKGSSPKGLKSGQHSAASSSYSPVRDSVPGHGHRNVYQKDIIGESSPNAKHSLRDVVKSSVIENGDLSSSSHSVCQMSLTSLEIEKHASPKSLCSSNGKGSLGIKACPKLEMGHNEVVAYSLCQLDHIDKSQDHISSSITENGKFSPSSELVSPTPSIESSHNVKHAPLHTSATSGNISGEIGKKMAEEKKVILSSGTGNQKLHEKYGHEHGDNAVGDNSSPSTTKLISKETAGELGKVETKDLGSRASKKIAAKTVSLTGSPKGRKASSSSRTRRHLVKPLIKTKNFVKRKSKKKINSNNPPKNVQTEFNDDLNSSANPIVCPRCQCVVNEAWRETNHQGSPGSQEESPLSRQDSSVSRHESPSPPSASASLSAGVSSGNVVSDVNTPEPSSDGLDKFKTPVESSSNSKSKYKCEFTQSSIGSLGECSSSTSITEESNISRPSFCDRPHMSKDVRWEAIRHVRFQHGTLGLRNFNLLKKLGCGDIGTVYLAELISTNCLFAIKVMDNEFLARRNKIARAQTEKEILRMLDHPFLPTLYCQFTSDNLSCLVMEYCPGGDLHVLRQRQPGRCFTELAARFYVAEVLLALEYLHMLGVVYRDLKPENILVREDGHIMLSDFDLSLRCSVSPTLLVSSSTSQTTSKNVSRPCVDSRCVQPLCIEPSFQVTCFTPRLLASSSKSSKLRKMKSDIAADMRPLLQLVAEPTTARSNSFVGTHEYLAPEIIKGEGHGSAVDWWTFGVFLYELLYGRTPFKGASNEDTLANVVLQSLKFPDSPLVSLQARDLISALLVKEPENRLGTERGAAEIKQHPFFEGLNWALIRCAVPPELPEHTSFRLPKATSLEKNSKYAEYSSGCSGLAEQLEFEVF